MMLNDVESFFCKNIVAAKKDQFLFTAVIFCSRSGGRCPVRLANDTGGLSTMLLQMAQKTLAKCLLNVYYCYKGHFRGKTY